MTPPHDDGQLDAQIKDLLGRAVAETPQPPELDHTMLMKSNISQPNKRNPWIIGGGIGLSAAAAIAAFAIIPGLGDESTIQTPPATQTVTIPDGSDDTIAPVTTVADGTDDTATDSEPTPVAIEPEPVDVEAPTIPTNTDESATEEDTSPDPSVPEPTTAPSAPTQTSGSEIVVAGPNGVTGADTTLLSEPTALAMRGPDGRLWTQTEAWSWTAQDNPIVAIDVATGARETIAVPTPDQHGVELLDVATVQGQLTVLYATAYLNCDGLVNEDCTMSLRTFQPATGAAATVFEQNAWESGWAGFQLANNGIIAGTLQDLVIESPVFYNVSTGVTPTPASLGLEESYNDCPTCPRSLTIDEPGVHVGWLENDGDMISITITELATGERVTVETDAGIADFADRLQLADVTIDGGVVESGTAVVGTWLDGTGATTLSIDLTTGATTVLAVGDTRATIR